MFESLNTNHTKYADQRLWFDNNIHESRYMLES